MNKPLVSVIICTYNGKEKRLKQAIESVLSQSYKNIELIIINDASINNIEEFILNCREKYGNIIYLKNENNSERSYSRNRGIFESKGKYIAFLDDDDIWHDYEKIQKQVVFFNNNEDAVLCGTSIIEVDELNNEKGKILMRANDDILKKTLLQSNQFALSSVMIKKDVLCFSGLFNSNYNKAEDYDLWLRIGRYGKIGNIRDSFIYYRTWQGNTTSKGKFKIKMNAFRFMWVNKRYYPNFYKALILRIGDFIIPEKLKNYLLKLKSGTIKK